MRISDWSSDVCSSDLLVAPRGIGADHGMIGEPLAKRRGQGAESGQLRHAVEIGGEMLAPKAQLFAQSLLLLDQIGGQVDRKSTRLNSSHSCATRMPSSA